MKVKPIESEREHQWALRVLRKLKNAERGSEEYQYREVLKALVLKYENEQYPFGEPEFEDWAESLQVPGVVEEKIKAIEEAEVFIQEAEKFEERRLDSIKKVMEQRGIRQRDLVDILSVDKSYISLLLNGKKPFSLVIISKLHHYLQIPLEQLVPPPELLEPAEQD